MSTDPNLGMSADAVLTTTRAVRKRLDLDRPVGLDVIRECLQIALQAPSASNEQSWQFFVVTDPAKRLAVADVYRRAFVAYRENTLSSGRLQGGDAAHNATATRVFDSAAYLAEHLHEVPVLLLPLLRGRSETLTSARAQAVYWAGIIPATWSFMLAARERGLGTCWTTMHLRYEQEVADILGIPAHDYTQAALVPVAYTRGTDFRAGAREELDGVLHVDTW